MTYQNGAPAHSIGVPTPWVIVESVDVVPNPSGDRRECGRPPSSCRNSMRARNLTDVARRTVRLPRVVIRGGPATSRTLRRVSVLRPAPSSSRYRWLKPWAAASSCRHPWLKPWAAASSCRHPWLKPWVMQTSTVCRTHTPVTIVVQTRGSTSSSCR